MVFLLPSKLALSCHRLWNDVLPRRICSCTYVFPHKYLYKRWSSSSHENFHFVGWSDGKLFVVLWRLTCTFSGNLTFILVRAQDVAESKRVAWTPMCQAFCFPTCRISHNMRSTYSCIPARLSFHRFLPPQLSPHYFSFLKTLAHSVGCFLSNISPVIDKGADCHVKDPNMHYFWTTRGAQPQPVESGYGWTSSKVRIEWSNEAAFVAESGPRPSR